MIWYIDLCIYIYRRLTLVYIRVGSGVVGVMLALAVNSSGGAGDVLSYVKLPSAVVVCRTRIMDGYAKRPTGRRQDRAGPAN